MHKDPGDPLNATEARELFEIRMALDPAAGNSPPNAGPTPTSNPAERRQTPRTSHPGLGREGLLAHSAFHRAIYVASHNDNMIIMLDGLWDKSDRYRRLGLMLPSGAENRERDFIEHRKMMEIIVDGCPGRGRPNAPTHPAQPHRRRHQRPRRQLGSTTTGSR